MATATVVVTWNQTDLTLACLGSLTAAGVALSDVLVVDNGSRPAALPRVRERFAGVRTLRLEQNTGFAAGCNAGALAALDAGAEALFFLNNDATVEPETLGRLEARLADDPNLGAVGPKVYYYGSDRIIQSVGLRVDRDSGDVRMIGSGEPDRGQHDQAAERQALFGCAMLVRREAWEQAGPFWEPFFSYAEEVDWCMRAGALGWRLGYEPGALVWHQGGRSLGAGAPLAHYLMARNQLLLRDRHRRAGLHGLRGLAYALYVRAMVVGRALRAGRTAQARAVALGSWDYLRGRVGNSRTVDLRLGPPNR